MSKIRFLGRHMRYIVTAVFFLLTAHIIYQYLMYSATEVEVKTGTFVEALTPGHEISYVPYTQIGSTTRLYQSFFYDACLDYVIDGDAVSYVADACAVTTNDNKQYIIRLKDRTRPNGTTVSLDDVYTTYKSILIDNVWDIPSFAAYKDVAMEQRAEDIVVTFPQASVDNRIFFTYFILPVEVTGLDFEEYRARASVASLGSACGQLNTTTKDETSVVFDLSQCDDTLLNNYQLKYLPTGTTAEQFDYIDMVKGSASHNTGFVQHNVPNRNYMFLFFNNESSKLSPKIQRALGGYINKTFANTGVNDYLIDDKIIFTQFLSIGDNVATYVASKNPELPVDKFDLEKINITPIPANITLKRGDKPVYFLESINGYKTTRIYVDSAYDSVTISHNGGAAYAPRTYNKSTKSFYYTVAPYNSNIVEGLNEYVIKGKRNGKEVTIADIDIYFLTTPLQDEVVVKDENKLRILYVYHPIIDKVVERLKIIFAEAGMEDYFLFDGYTDPDSFEGKLLSQEYDLVLRIVNMGQRSDLRSLFVGKNPVLNPSLYSDAGFIAALEQYTTSPDNEKIRNNINTLYGKDAPFMILGELFDVVSVQNDIESQVGSGTARNYLYTMHRKIYDNVSLGTRLSLERKDIFNRENMKRFFWTSAGTKELVEETVIDETVVGEEQNGNPDESPISTE